MNDDIFNDESLKKKIKDHERQGRLFALAPILVNIIAIVSFICALAFAGNINVSFILILFPGFIFPIMAFIYSLIIQKIYFECPKPFWIIGFIINIIIFVFYSIGILIWGFIFFIFSGFNFFCW